MNAPEGFRSDRGGPRLNGERLHEELRLPELPFGCMLAFVLLTCASVLVVMVVFLPAALAVRAWERLRSPRAPRGTALPAD